MSLERLDKILSGCLPMSRSELKKAAKLGRVTLNGKTVTDLSEKARTDIDEICFDSKKLNTAKHIYIMLNKPEGVICASNGNGEKSVIDLLPEDFKRDGLFPAGRLDKDTTGFVLITDDGDFAHSILSPKNHVEKTYVAQLDAGIDEAGVNELEGGLMLRDGTRFLPAKLCVLNRERTKVEIRICEGKYHQVKRMFKAVGCNVTSLERIAIGGLELDKKLGEGCSRLLSDEEIKKIKE